MKVKQIVINLDNDLNRFFQVTYALGKGGINLRALSHDQGSYGTFGFLRIIVADVAKVRRILMGAQIPAFINEVVVFEVDDTPGSLAKALLVLKEAGVHSVLTYSFPTNGHNKAINVSRFSDNDKAIEALQRAGIKVYSQDEFIVFENEQNERAAI
jgi:hypothetical protein